MRVLLKTGPLNFHNWELQKTDAASSYNRGSLFDFGVGWLIFEFAWPLVLALVELWFKVHIHLWFMFQWLHVACQGVSVKCIC